MTLVRDVIFAAGHSSSLRDQKEEEAELERYSEDEPMEGNTSFPLSFQQLLKQESRLCLLENQMGGTVPPFYKIEC